MLSDPLLGGGCASQRKSCAEIQALGASDEAARALGITLPAQLDRAVESRRIEFLAGRLAAREALSAAGCDKPAALPIAQGRWPEWPKGFTGSIAHSHGLAWAAAGPTGGPRAVRAVGIDLERILEDDRAARLAPAILSEAEQSRNEVATLGWGPYVSLLFSAKEALYKCLNPLFGVEFDFHDLEAGSIDCQLGELTLHLALPAAHGYDAGHAFPLRFRIAEQMVWTAIEL
jgi:enterobactin synthetase component D